MILSDAEMIFRLFLSCLVGLLLGRERKRRNKPVGSRTHILVCMAATIISILSAYGFEEFQGHVQMDPARLMVGILSGIGFIGAGIIWKDNTGDIRGITTAANIFLAACLGIAIGIGEYLLVATATALGIITLEGPSFLRRTFLAKGQLTNGTVKSSLEWEDDPALYQGDRNDEEDEDEEIRTK